MSMNMTGVMVAYTGHLHAAGRSPHTIKQYTCWPRRLLHDLDKPVGAITATDVDAWLAGHTWKPASRKACIGALRRFFAWARRTGLADDDPTDGLPTIRIPEQPPAACPDHVYAAALARARGVDYWRLRAAADTGMRCAELAALTSADLRPGPAVLVHGKGGRQRLVPVPPDLAGWLAANGTLWEGRTPGAVSIAYRRLLGGWGAHSLRHRYATGIYTRTHDLEAVRQLLGHASIATTQRYIWTEPDALRTAAATMWAA